VVVVVVTELENEMKRNNHRFLPVTEGGWRRAAKKNGTKTAKDDVKTRQKGAPRGN